jgi:hypothetical protein
MRLATPLALLVVVLAAAVSFAVFNDKPPIAVNVSGTLTSSTDQHPMGKACSGSDPSLCRLTVSGIRADEADPKHSPITISVEKHGGVCF